MIWPVIELSLPSLSNCDLPLHMLALYISRCADQVSYYKLIIGVWPMAHHAGYLWRIHWPENHSAHGAGVADSIGQGST